MSTATENMAQAQFEVGEDAELEVHNVSGRVTVRTHEDNVITMQAVLHGSHSAIDNTRIEQQQHGNRVVVRTVQRHEGDGTGWIRGQSLASVDYDLMVPRGCALNVNTVSADIDAQGAGGRANLHSVSGRLRLTDASGAIVLHSVSGAVDAQALNGELDVNSTSGNVTVHASQLRRVALHTVSGDMTIATPLTAGETYTVSTVSGNLSLTVPSGTGADVSLSTVSGRIRGPGSVHSSGGPGHRSWSGTFGDGGARITMNSVSGNLSLLESDSR